MGNFLGVRFAGLCPCLLVGMRFRSAISEASEPITLASATVVYREVDKMANAAQNTPYGSLKGCWK